MFMSGSKKRCCELCQGCLSLDYLHICLLWPQIRVVRSSTNMYEHVRTCICMCASRCELTLPFNAMEPLPQASWSPDCPSKCCAVKDLVTFSWAVANQKVILPVAAALGISMDFPSSAQFKTDSCSLVWLFGFDSNRQGTPKSKGQSSLSLCTCHLGVYLIFSHTHLESV